MIYRTVVRLVFNVIPRNRSFVKIKPAGVIKKLDFQIQLNFQRVNSGPTPLAPAASAAFAALLQPAYNKIFIDIRDRIDAQATPRVEP